MFSRFKNAMTDNDDGSLHHGGSDNNYMRNKIRKLERQGISNDIRKSSSIFQGCHIFVNGYTQPSRNEIKQLVHLHGGTFDSYQTSKTTHFICDVFPNAKINELRKPHRDRTFYVTTSWLTESIASQSRLNEGEYLPPGLNNQHGSKLLISRNARVIDTCLTTSSSSNKSGVSISNPPPEQASPPPPIKTTTTAKSTLSDPDFLHHYYGASRLHFIGSWKSRLPDLLAELIPTGDHAPRSEVRPNLFAASSTRKRVVLHVDMDCFFVSALIRDKYENNDCFN